MPHVAQKRIALMLPRFSRYGGVEQFGYRLAGALAEHGFAVDVLCARAETPPPAGVRTLCVGRFGGVKVLKMLWFLIRVEQLRRTGGYDVSISLGKTWNQDIDRTGGGPLQVFWRLSQEAWPVGLPRTQKRLSRWLQPANWLSFFIEQHMYRTTPHVVAISHIVRQWIEEVYPHLSSDGASAVQPGTVEQTLHTIYNCPDVSRFRPPSPQERQAARVAFRMNEGEYALGVATTNFALKGVAQLIQALVSLPDDTHLHVAGGRGPKVYVALARKLGVEHRVHFHGKVQDMQSFYHSLDMFVLPTFYDTLGNVVLEALRCGLKTICSNRAGAAFFLPPAQVLQNPADAQDIVRHIRVLRGAEGNGPLAEIPEGAGIPELIALVDRVLCEKEQAVVQ